MANDFGNDPFATTYDPAAEAKRLEEELAKHAADEVSFKPTHKIEKGVVNSFIVIPARGGRAAWRDIIVHFNPFHICGRPDPAWNPETEDYVRSKRFADCHRCISTWNSWLEHRDTPGLEDASKSYMKANMENHRGIVQVLSFTPFMPTGKVTKQTNALIKEWMEDYISIARAATLGENFEIPEGMPEDIADHAQRGVGLMMVNKTTLVGIRNAHNTHLKFTKKSPFTQPQQYVLQVSTKEDSTKRFFGTDGKERSSVNYTVSIEDVNDLRFKVPDSAIEMIREVWSSGALVDIHALDRQEIDEVEDKPHKFARFSDNDEMAAFLDGKGWSPVCPEARPATSIPEKPASTGPASDLGNTAYNGEYAYAQEPAAFEEADMDDDELPF